MVNKRIFNFICILVLIFTLLVIQTTPIEAAGIIIAAYDSASSWKSQAAVICDGVGDQVEINARLTAGNTVTLAPGNYRLNGYIIPQAGSKLLGQGNTTVINLSNGSILVSDVSNVELGYFKLSGVGDPSAVYINARTVDISGVSVHDIYCTVKGTTDFQIYADSGRKVSKMSFVRDTADSPDGFGFVINGTGYNPVAEDITFYRCSVINAGVASTRLISGDGDCWITGFDFAEYPSMTVSRVQVIKCSVNGAWESGYHFEIFPVKKDIVIMDCSATGAGYNTSGLYSTGFLIAFRVGTDDIVLSQNTGGNNRLGDLKVWDAGLDNYRIYTPPQDTIVSTTGETAARVNQGNCIGLIITNGSYKELVLYSSDGNTVNQWIELGSQYLASDGEVYAFSGTQVQASFSGYKVMRLVKSTSTNLNITSGSVQDGTVGMSYSQTLTASGGSPPYVWTIATGTLPAGLIFSSGGLISGIPTTAGGPVAITFRVTDATGSAATKTLSMTISYSIWDVNMDGTINILDIINISQRFGQSGPAGWIRQDINKDGSINVLDLTIVGQHLIK